MDEKSGRYKRLWLWRVFEITVFETRDMIFISERVRNIQLKELSVAQCCEHCVHGLSEVR